MGRAVLGMALLLLGLSQGWKEVLGLLFFGKAKSCRMGNRGPGGENCNDAMGAACPGSGELG